MEEIEIKKNCGTIATWSTFMGVMCAISAGMLILMGLFFIVAACCGIDLSFGQLILIVVTATLASIGTAGVSGAGVIMLAMVLETIGVPVEMIMIIYGVDRLFDMGRTTLNITGDIACSLCVTSWEKKKAAKAAAK